VKQKFRVSRNSSLKTSFFGACAARLSVYRFVATDGSITGNGPYRVHETSPSSHSFPATRGPVPPHFCPEPQRAPSTVPRSAASSSVFFVRSDQPTKVGFHYRNSVERFAKTKLGRIVSRLPRPRGQVGALFSRAFRFSPKTPW